MGGKKFYVWWSSPPEIDWENANTVEIKKETARYLFNEIHEHRFGGNYIGEIIEVIDSDLLKVGLSKTNINKGIKVKCMKYYSAGKKGLDTWISDLRYVNKFISNDEKLKNTYADIYNENTETLDSLIINYAMILEKDSILLAGGGSNYWKDGMNDYFGKIISITNNEAIIQLSKSEYPFGRFRSGDEVYLMDDY